MALLFNFNKFCIHVIYKIIFLTKIEATQNFLQKRQVPVKALTLTTQHDGHEIYCSVAQFNFTWLFVPNIEKNKLYELNNNNTDIVNQRKGQRVTRAKRRSTSLPKRGSCARYY